MRGNPWTGIVVAIAAGYLTLLLLGGTPPVVEATDGAVAPTRTGASSTASQDYAKAVVALDALITRDPAVVTTTLAGSHPVLVAFLDRRCSSCLRMVPLVADLQRDFAPTVNVIALDTDDKSPEFRQLFRRFHIWAGPAFIFFDGHGHLLERLIGPQPRTALWARLRALAAGKETIRR